jgi:hypothetical protein
MHEFRLSTGSNPDLLVPRHGHLTKIKARIDVLSRADSDNACTCITNSPSTLRICAIAWRIFHGRFPTSNAACVGVEGESIMCYNRLSHVLLLQAQQARHEFVYFRDC